MFQSAIVTGQATLRLSTMNQTSDDVNNNWRDAIAVEI